MPKFKSNLQRKTKIQLCDVPDAEGIDTLKATAADNKDV